MYAGKTLHILNGDATKDIFLRTDLKTESYTVWREMMCEGPAEEFLHDPAFWKKREQYICKHFGETPEGYFDKVIMEQIRLEAFLSDYDEIILWFEHDVFCQINLVALLAWLNRLDLRGQKLYTVSIGSHPEIERFKGYGQLSPRQLHQLLPHKMELSKADIHFAESAWKAYASKTPADIEQLLNNIPPHFPFLKSALQLHLQRLPHFQTRINLLEQKILQQLQENVMEKYELMRWMVEDDLEYGFTDRQFLAIIHRLKPFYDITDNGLQINQAGLDILNGKANGSLLPPQSVGCIAAGYYWEPTNGKTVMC
ncbi:MAG: hypothetical protein SFW35_14100 [Chitinophagales bacterium]|nr:hypothetical protein [Chitinophagales bacterium]